MEDGILKKIEVPFTQVANEPLNDPNLSWKAKGIYSYMRSKPNGWKFAVDRMARDTKDKRDGTLAGVLELVEAGYIHRYKKPDGRMDYTILHKPKPKPEIPVVATEGEPKPEKPTVGKTHSGKSRPISNKEYNNKYISNKEGGGKKPPAKSEDFAPVAGNETNRVMKLFYDHDPANQTKNWYGNKTQRECAEQLIRYHGLEKIEKLITQTIPKVNKMKYMPYVKTPKDLWDKWREIADKLMREKSISQTVKHQSYVAK